MSIQVNRSVLFDRAQQLADSGEVDAALDLLYDHFDELLLANDFSEVAILLGQLEPANHSAAVLLTVLTVTLPARTKLLPTRDEAFAKIKRTLLDRGEPADELLFGLEYGGRTWRSNALFVFRNDWPPIKTLPASLWANLRPASFMWVSFIVAVPER